MHHQTKPLNKSETAHTLLSLRHLGSMGGAAHAKPSGNTSAYLDGMPPGTVLRGRSGYEPPTASMPPLIGQPAQFHGVIASPPMVQSMHASVTPMQGLVGSMSASMATPMLANEPPMHGRAGGLVHYATSGQPLPGGKEISVVEQIMSMTGISGDQKMQMIHFAVGRDMPCGISGGGPQIFAQPGQVFNPHTFVGIKVRTNACMNARRINHACPQQLDASCLVFTVCRKMLGSTPRLWQTAWTPQRGVCPLPKSSSASWPGPQLLRQPERVVRQSGRQLMDMALSSRSIGTTRVRSRRLSRASETRRLAATNCTR